MKIKLLKDITENGQLKVAKHRGKFVPFTAGSVIEASDTTAAKWIAAGLAESHKEPEPALAESP